MIKKIIFITILILSQFFLYTTQAEFSCESNGGTEDKSSPSPVCEQSPEFVDKYIEDMMYVISSLPYNKKVYKNISGLGSKALNVIGGAFTIVQVLPDTFGGFFSNFIVLFEDKSIVRDRTKIIGFKGYISSRTIGEVKKSGLYEKVEGIDKIKKFVNNNPNFFITIKGNTYKDVYNFLRVNQQIFEEIFFQKVIIGSKNYEIKSKIEFNLNSYDINKEKVENMIEKMKIYTDPYPICSSTWESFMNSIKDIVCNFGQFKTDKALNRFTCNYNRLRNALFGENNTPNNCGNVQLKKWVPLNKRVKITGMGKIMKDAEELKELIVDRGGEIIDDMLDMYQNEVVFAEKITPEQKPDLINKNLIITNLLDTSNSIINKHNAIKKSFVDIEPGEFTHNITRQAVSVSKNIYEISKLIDGAGEDYEDSASGKLTETCEKQSPYKGKCKKSINKK